MNCCLLCKYCMHVDETTCHKFKISKEKCENFEHIFGPPYLDEVGGFRIKGPPDLIVMRDGINEPHWQLAHTIDPTGIAYNSMLSRIDKYGIGHRAGGWWLLSIPDLDIAYKHKQHGFIFTSVRPPDRGPAIYTSRTPAAVYKLRREGFEYQKIAEILAIVPETFSRWRSKFPVFDNAIIAAEMNEHYVHVCFSCGKSFPNTGDFTLQTCPFCGCDSVSRLDGTGPHRKHIEDGVVTKCFLPSVSEFLPRSGAGGVVTGKIRAIKPGDIIKIVRYQCPHPMAWGRCTKNEKVSYATIGDVSLKDIGYSEVYFTRFLKPPYRGQLISWDLCDSPISKHLKHERMGYRPGRI